MTDWELVPAPDCEFIGFMRGPHWGAIAYGSIAGRAIVVVLDRDGVAREIRPDVDRLISSAASLSDDEYYFILGRSFPTIRAMFVPVESIGDAYIPAEGAVRAWMDVPLDNVMTLFAREDGVLELVDGEELEEFESPLRLTGDPDAIDLVICGFGESGLYVSGPVQAEDGRAALAWRNWSRHLASSLWAPIEPAGSMFTVTDIYDVSGVYDSVVWIAGHHESEVVIQDSDGRVLDLPSSRLDPSSPTVRLIDGINAIAVQTVDGPRLWTRPAGTDQRQILDRQHWRVEELPPGRISAGYRTVRYGDERPELDDRLFIIVDGQVWHRALEGPLPS